MNVFEGARRIRLLAQVVIVITGLVIAVTHDPRARVTFETNGPTDGWTLVKAECRYEDARRTIYDYALNDAVTAQIDLCFRAQTFGKGSTGKLVPYVHEGEWDYGDQPYSDAVQAYTQKRELEFVLPPAMRKQTTAQAKDAAWSDRLRNLKETAIFIVAGVVGLWLLAWVIGWIFRGFAGIPSGQDKKPQNGGMA